MITKIKEDIKEESRVLFKKLREETHEYWSVTVMDPEFRGSDPDFYQEYPTYREARDEYNELKKTSIPYSEYMILTYHRENFYDKSSKVINYYDVDGENIR